MGTKEVNSGPCATCNRPHVMGIWWPRHPYKAQVRVQVDPLELDANGNNDGRYPCSECGQRVMFAIPRGDRPTCGDCLEGRTSLKIRIATLSADLAKATQLATRWQVFTEGRVLAGVQVAMVQLDAVLGSLALTDGDPRMVLVRVLERVQDEIIRAGTKGPPLTHLEAPHNCPDDDASYPDTCPGCRADAERGA